MAIDWWTLALQTINALVLIWLLTRFLFSPVAAMIKARQAAANKLLDDAQFAQSMAEEDRKQAKQSLADLAQERNAALEVITAEVKMIKSNLIKKAKQEADAILDKSHHEKTRLQHKNDTDTHTHAATLALEITDKLLSRLPEAARIAGFVDGIIVSLEKLPELEKHRLTNDDYPLKLSVAVPMTEQQRQECEQSVARALGGKVRMELSTDRTLIAGLELIGPHFAVRNNFRADLARLSNALSCDES
jgi:F-type H+-transporting ATPase subunit b